MVLSLPLGGGWNKKREGQEKEIVGLDAQLLGKERLLELVEAELGEILPLIAIGTVSKSDRFKLDRIRPRWFQK